MFNFPPTLDIHLVQLPWIARLRIIYVYLICCICVTEKYQLDMMKSLRQVNVDHYHVGWYQSSDVGNFLSLPLLESQFHYQTSIEESVVLIFGRCYSVKKKKI